MSQSPTVEGHQTIHHQLGTEELIQHSIDAGNGELAASGALAVTTAKRSAAAPELPTIAEAGLPGYEATSWFGLIPARKTWATA